MLGKRLRPSAIAILNLGIFLIRSERTNLSDYLEKRQDHLWALAIGQYQDDVDERR
ncbi:hypothetical protein D046_2262 [Vibrio parahaemolyticus V-223/04]|nr:hypothetical protein D046_2262 [Vibrio parahaemolyticus V-223/04]